MDSALYRSEGAMQVCGVMDMVIEGSSCRESVAWESEGPGQQT
jgi:hypothetical protein